MSPDPFFQPGVIWRGPADSSCGTGCSCHGHSGFCGACIHPECLRLGADGSVRVGLSASPEDWFSTLSALGNVLHLTRNKLAVLGQIGPVPALLDGRNPVLPRDASGCFAPNLAEHASLWAVREPSALGTAYGFETHDVSGHAFQRIVLTAPANRELFERFVTDHQSPPEEAADWFPPNHNTSTQRRSAITRRIPFLRACFATNKAQVQLLSARIIPELFAAVAGTGLPIRTTHYTSALIRAAVWTPQVCESSGTAATVEFFHNDDTGLHVFLPEVAGVWLWQGRCNCCEQEHWTIEVADANDHVGLAITVGENQLEAQWREIISASCHRITN